MSEHIIKHVGVVSNINEGIATIKLLNISACSSCHAKSVCNVSEVDNKEIEVLVENNSIKTGEHINVLMNNSLGVKALFFGYVIPFLFMLASLLISWSITSSETVSGIAAIAILAPYYLLLTLFRKRFEQTFAFKIEKLNVSI